MKFRIAIAVVAVVCAFSIQAKADVIETLLPGPGIDLANIYVGDQVVFISQLSSTDAGEHFCCAVPDIHIFWSTSDIQFLGGFFVDPATVFTSDLSVNPVLVQWNFLAVNPSTQEIFTGFPACVGLPTVDTGCAITNLGSFRPLDSNHIVFNIQAQPVPEPGSLMLMAGALPVLGWIVRRRRGKL